MTVITEYNQLVALLKELGYKGSGIDWHNYLSDSHSTAEEKVRFARSINPQFVQLVAIYHPEVNTPLWKALEEDL